MPTAEKLNYTKTNIDELKTLTNETVLSNVVENIKQNYGKGTDTSEEWQPNPDWWDIDKILDNDTEEYEQKAIWLLNDLADTFPMSKDFQKADKIKMSDGAEYYNSTQVQTHTWDRSKDKECSLGYKTRYVIFYWNSSKIASYNLGEFKSEILYLIYKNVDFVNINQNYWFGQLSGNTECLKLINCKWSSSSELVLSLLRLKHIELGISGMKNNSMVAISNYFFSNTKLQEIYDFFHNESIETISYCFANSLNLIEIDLRNTENVKNFKNCFSGNDRLQIIRNLSLKSAVDVANMFQNCFSLKEIYISDIKIRGVSLRDSNYLSHASIIRIRNACYDYSTDTENVHSIIIGPENIKKLSEEELAEWLKLGWTVS